MLWCDVRARSGGMRVTELGEEPRLRFKILTRALPAGHADRPQAGDRLRDGARLYEIGAVHEADVRDRFLTLFSREVTERGAS